jgi:hypothetical protein
MAENQNKQTYGLSLNRNNVEDVPLMEWLDGMERGGTARALRAGLSIHKGIEEGALAVVEVGTIEALQAEIAALRRERDECASANANSSHAAAAPDPQLAEVINNNTRAFQALTAALARGIAFGSVDDSTVIDEPEPEIEAIPLCEMCETDPAEPDDRLCGRCGRLVGNLAAINFEF